MHFLYLRVQEKGKLASKWKKTFANVMKWKRRVYVDTLHFFFTLVQTRKRKEPSKKNIKKKTIKKKQKQKTASSPEQDLHPDWDRFRGTMLYPLSCGELAMNKR